MPRYVIHEHHARNLHFDLRLEIGGTLKSWAVPKGVSMNPDDKRLAVAVPDHPLSYINYEGEISEGSYGAGAVRIWDSGRFETTDSPENEFERGKIAFTVYGRRLGGGFILFKMARPERNWLIVKAEDEFADRLWQLKTVLRPREKTRSGRK